MWMSHSHETIISVICKVLISAKITHAVCWIESLPDNVNPAQTQPFWALWHNSLLCIFFIIFYNYKWFITLYLMQFVSTLANSWHKILMGFSILKESSLIMFRLVHEITLTCQIATFECGHMIRETLCNAGNWTCWQVCRRMKAGHNKKTKMISRVDKLNWRRWANQFVHANSLKSFSWNPKHTVIRIKQNNTL